MLCASASVSDSTRSGGPGELRRSLRRAWEMRSDRADRLRLEGDNRSRMHELRSQSPPECDAHRHRAAYVDVLHKLEKLVRPIAKFAPATPNRPRFLSP